MTNEKIHESRTVELKATGKLPYQKPSLEALGELSRLTMGSIPGTGESGDPDNYEHVPS